MEKRREKKIKIIEESLILSRKRLKLAEIRKNIDTVDLYNQIIPELEALLYAYKNFENDADRKRYFYSLFPF